MCAEGEGTGEEELSPRSHKVLTEAWGPALQSQGPGQTAVHS